MQSSATDFRGFSEPPHLQALLSRSVGKNKWARSIGSNKYGNLICLGAKLVPKSNSEVEYTQPPNRIRGVIEFLQISFVKFARRGKFWFKSKVEIYVKKKKKFAKKKNDQQEDAPPPFQVIVQQPRGKATGTNYFERKWEEKRHPPK